MGSNTLDCAAKATHLGGIPRRMVISFAKTVTSSKLGDSNCQCFCHMFVADGGIGMEIDSGIGMEINIVDSLNGAYQTTDFSWRSESSEDQEQITIARVLANICKDETGRLSQQQRRKMPAQRDKSVVVSSYYQQYVNSELVSRFQSHQPLVPPPTSKFLPFIRSIFPQKTKQQQQ